MKRRWLWLLLLLLVGASLLHPSVHWRLIGWVRGEAFYQGRPTTYWQQRIQEYQQLTEDERWSAWNDHWMRTVEKLLGLPPDDYHPAVLYHDDPATMPVRLELLRDANPDVRKAVALNIGVIGLPARPAIPILIDLLEDPDLSVQRTAANALMSYGPEEAKEAVPSLRQLLNHGDAGSRYWADRILQIIDPEAAKAGMVHP
jgi:hypothetical protein